MIGNEGLDLARALDQPALLDGDSYQTAGEWAKGIDSAASILVEGVAGKVGQSFNEGVDILVRPFVEEAGRGKAASMDGT